MRTLIFALLIVTLIYAFSFAGEAAINPDAMVLALSFDEGAGEVAEDASPLGNNVFLSEGAKWTEGKIGKCVRLKKPAHLNAEEPDLELHNTNLTLAMWVNFSEEPGWITLMNQFEAPQIGAKKWAWWYNAGAFVFHIDDAIADREWARSDFFGEPELNRWYHLAVVKQGNIHTHYVDGEPFGAQEKNVTVPEAIVGPFSIGATGIRYHFEGLLDEALIVRQALSQNDIRNHLAGGIQGVLSVEPSEKLATKWGSLKTGHELSGESREDIVYFQRDGG